jgi:hypothetical protein
MLYELQIEKGIFVGELVNAIPGGFAKGEILHDKSGLFQLLE